MSADEPRQWLLLIHQIPPEPNALRVKIWRRLQQIGAVAIKQSVYVMPLSGQSREDLSWTLKEIVDGGGAGTISEVRFKEGLTDEEIISLFKNARKADYEKVREELNHVSMDWSSQQVNPHDRSNRGQANVSRFRRRLEEIKAIDFFRSPERDKAESALSSLENTLSGRTNVAGVGGEGAWDTRGKTWVTREKIFVDRIASIWLIRRFVDPNASFRFVSDDGYIPQANEIRFDMFNGEFTHEGDKCTFEVMIERFDLHDPALRSVAEVVHDIDLKDGKFDRPETWGFNALLVGLVSAQPDDGLRMAEGMRLLENLYCYFQNVQPK